MDKGLQEFIAQEKLQDLGLKDAWRVYKDAESHYINHNGLEIQKEERTTHDIITRIVKFHNKDITDKQANYLRILLERIGNRANILAQRAKEREQAENCPSGRVELTGVILKVSTRAGRFGVEYKMLLKTDKGFLVWGTQPSSIGTAQKGARVKLTAQVKPSDKDTKFGFYKRPTCAVVIE